MGYQSNSVNFHFGIKEPSLPDWLKRFLTGIGALSGGGEGEGERLVTTELHGPVPELRDGDAGGVQEIADPVDEATREFKNAPGPDGRQHGYHQMVVKNCFDFYETINAALPDVKILKGEAKSMIYFAHKDKNEVMAKYKELKSKEKDRKNPMKLVRERCCFITLWTLWDETPEVTPRGEYHDVFA
jgi:hypothetical protein